VDEVRPWVDGLAEFGAALVSARPDIGLAPLLDEPFNRAKSELHWLEYAMAGAPTIATAFSGSGPYDVIKDGMDGLLARTAADWGRHLRILAGSREMRLEIAGNARARVLAEYSLSVRTAEWVDAYQWSAAHAASGRAGAGAAPGAVAVASSSTPPFHV
jgi:glycosyltransferase involved in cell wall biosynthesis